MIWNPVNNIVLVSKTLGDFPMWVLRLIASIQLFLLFPQCDWADQVSAY